MEDQKKHIDDLYRQQLNDYQEAPRAGMWDRIEANLDKTDTTPTPGTKKPGGSRGLLGYSALLLVILATVFFIYKQSSKNIGTNKTPIVNQTNTIQEKTTNINTSTIGSTTANNNKLTSKVNKGQSTNAANNNALNDQNNVAISSEKAHSANRAAKSRHAAGRSYNAHNNNSSNIALKEKRQQNKKAKNNTQTADEKTTVEDNNKQGSTTDVAIAAAHSKKQYIPHQKQADKVTDQSSTEPVTIAKTKSKEKDANTKNPSSAVTSPRLSGSDIVTSTANAVAATKDKNAGYKPKHKKTDQPTQNNVTVATNTSSLKNNAVAKPVANTTTDKKIAATEKKTGSTNADMPASPAVPQSKPIAANKNATKELLKQEVLAADDNTKAAPATTSNKADSSVPNTAPAAANGGSDDIAHQTPTAFSLQAGLKLGYEQGFATYTTSKFLGAVYAQVALADKWSVLFQPAITYTQLNGNITYNSSSYYNNTGVHSTQTIISIDTLAKDTLARYHYYGAYDSIIVKRQNSSSAYVGFEIPVMLKYKLSKSFSVLGGVDIDISKVFGIGDKTTTIHLSTPTDTTAILHSAEAAAFFDSLTYRHPGIPYSSYVPTPATNTQNSVRLGYMIGVDYSIADKFTLEFLVTQSLSGYNNISDKNIKSLYSQPYFRLSVGYQFLNFTKKKVPYNGGL